MSNYTGNKNALRHGMHGTRFYSIWSSMKTRCYNPKAPDYSRYGGRGIVVCDAWQSFDLFMRDMYGSYLQHVAEFGIKDTQIDRENNNGNYEPDNCRWVTWIENQNNKHWNPKSAEHRKKISLALKGKPKSAEHIEHNRQAQLNRTK